MNLCHKHFSVDITNVLYIFSISKACPRIRFNKDGTLLAVSANENRIKILATADGVRLLRTYDSHSLVALRVASETLFDASETLTMVCSYDTISS